MDDETKWSIAVYLAGGDGLSEGMVRALKELRDGSSSASSERGVQVLAQFEPRNKIPRLFAFPGSQLESAASLSLSPSRRRALSPHALASYEYLLDGAAGEGATSQELLSQFIRLAHALGKAENFMLVFSGHGSGAVGDLFGYRGANRTLQLKDLSRAMAAAGLAPGDKIDVIGMDCCNMSMVEVGFELAPYARFLVASESIVPNHGWPYRQILEEMHALPPDRATAEIVRQYADFYTDYTLLGMATHCAATDLRNMNVLTEPIERLAESVGERIHACEVWQPVVLAHWEAQSYKNEEYVDLVDFCERLHEHIGSSQIRRACVNVVEAVGEVVQASLCTGASFQYSTGLSIYFPWSNDMAKARGELGTPSDLDEYKALSFSQKTRWALCANITETLRPLKLV